MCGKNCVQVLVNNCCGGQFTDELNGFVVNGTFADTGEPRTGDVALNNGFAEWKTDGSNVQYLTWNPLKEANGIITVSGIRLNTDGAWGFKFGFNLVGIYGTCNGWGIRVESGSEMSIFEIMDNGGVEDPKVFTPTPELSETATLTIMVNKDSIDAYLSASGWSNVYNVSHTVANRSNRGAKGIGMQLTGFNGGANGKVDKVTMEYRDLFGC